MPKTRKHKREELERADRAREGHRSNNPRVVAYDVLTRVHMEDAFSNIVLPAVLNKTEMTLREKSFVTELVYGTLRWQGLLDAVIAAAAKRDLEKINNRLIDVLRLGGYQALFMDIADYALVSQTVEIASKRVGKHTTGFVNAVMRKISARSRQEWESIVISRIPKTDSAGRLAVRYSHPQWIVSQLIKAWDNSGYSGHPEDSGNSAVSDISAISDMLATDNEPADVTLVARPGLISKEDLIKQLSESSRWSDGLWSPYAVRVHGVNPQLLEAARQGRAGVEDEGSQLAALTLVHTQTEPSDSQKWLDMCAGPGGKTALLAACAQKMGATLLANEPSKHRAGLVRENLKAFPNTIIEDVIEKDGREIGSLYPNTFDRILVDAPCSGLGALRRRPESRWRKSSDDISTLSSLQVELLNSALNAVKPGGIVAYVTCSPVVAETSEVVNTVLSQRDDAEQINTSEVLQQIAPEIPLPDQSAHKLDVQLFEHLHNTDQMYISLIARR